MKRKTPSEAFNIPVSSIPVSGPTLVIDYSGASDFPQHSPSGVISRSAIDLALLQRVLDFSLSIPVDQGESPTIRFALEGLCRLFSEPRIAIGVRGTDGQAVVTQGPSAESIQFHGGSGDLRVFHTSHEVTVPFPTAERGWLTVGMDAEPSPDFVETLTRVAAVLERATVIARSHAAAKAVEDEMRALNARMVQAQKLATLGELAAGMVHELNNPLTSIVAYTEYLERKWRAEGAPADDLERLGRISESSSRMLRFTRDLVSYARVPNERPSPIPLHSVIDRALAFCEHVLAESKTVVRRAYAEESPTVLGLAEPLAQVFVNLVTNACHAMGEDGGTIVIVTEPRETTVDVRVLDSGHGIPEPNRAKVFVPFFTTKESGKGSGLGLSIVKNIIDGHGGSIEVGAGELGGAMFTIRLPRPSM